MKGVRFKIIGLTGLYGIPKNLYVNGKKKYARIMIQRVKEGEIMEVNKTLMDFGKKFLIIGNMNAITYKEVFPYIKNNELWLGVSITSGDRRFDVPNDYPLEAATCGIDEDGVHFIRVKGVRWFTNLDHKKRHEALDLYKHYTPEEFPHYDNYDAIEVSKVCDIPMDYEGVMGVPITFLDKYCPSQFEIVGKCEPCIDLEVFKTMPYFHSYPSRQIMCNGKLCQKTYHRLLIKRVSK